MQDLYKLKDMLCKELKEYGKQGELTAGTLDVVDKLAHALKNLDKVIDKMDEEYSNGSYARGGSYEGMSNASYARGRGRGARRDSMGRYSRDGGSYGSYGSYDGSYARAEGYSRHDDMMADLQSLKDRAVDEHTKQMIQSIMAKMGSM